MGAGDAHFTILTSGEPTMNRKTVLCAVLAPLLAALMVACGGSDYDDPPPPPAPPVPVAVGDTIALTISNRLVSFNRSAPQTVVGSVQVSGLMSGEMLLAVDLRPADGLLYALSDRGRVFTLDAWTGTATLKASLMADPADTSDPFVSLAGTTVAIDFNPTVDRLRVVSSSGQNLRVNVDTGATTTDGLLNLVGATPTVVAAAYTNSFDGATATQLFDLNAVDQRLYVQAPPNDGTLSAAPQTPIALGVSFTAAADIDIDAVSNVGYALLTVGGATQLFSIDLRATNDAATTLGAVAIGEPVRGLAINRRAPAATVTALTTDNRLLRFDPRAPNTITGTVALAVPTGEGVVGIDIRPSDGRLYALTRAADNTGRVYTVDENSGAMALVAALDTALAGSQFAVDFNPAANALRVVSETGQSLAVNLTTLPGTVTINGAINSAMIPSPVVVAAAYLNSGLSATPPAATTLYSLEASTDVLTMQVPATGTLTTVGALGRDIGGTTGFDIAGDRNGRALAAFGANSAAPYMLFEVNLATGATVLPRGLSAEAARIGGASGPALRDIAIRF
jgi:hypothetical protein